MAEVHKHIIVTGYVDSAPTEDFKPTLEQWFLDMIKEVDMNVLIPPQVIWCPTLGNEGMTGIVCIETSHSSIHFWSEPTPHYRFDLYSCKDYSLASISKMLYMLGTTKFTYTIIDRTDDAHPVTESGTIEF